MSEKLTLSLPVTSGEAEFLCKLEARYGKVRVVKKSLDARSKQDIKWIYSIETGEPMPEAELERVNSQPKCVLIAGAGPAGLFCAERLVRRGIKPILVERGACVDERKRDVEAFLTGGKLNESSNIQFGEGGAGTFSDGKLNTQTKNPLNKSVFSTFVRYGAPTEIAYLQKPHIGSDKLSGVVKNMRNFIIENGGKVLFNTALTGIKTENGGVKSVTLSDGSEIEVSELVLAIGHSARDTFKMLYDLGFAMEQKDFAVGFRIEHPQEEIGKSQYGKAFRLLPPADYKLVSHASERAVFTFCMCPGGVVIPAASEEGGVVVNGMSEYARDKTNANSAIVAQVKKEDFCSEHPLAGVEYQRKLERSAFKLGGGEYKAPAQRVGDYLKRRASTAFTSVTPSYARGVTPVDLSGLLPEKLDEAIRNALPDMAKRLKGFDSADAVLTGVESRTSSPVRILRDESRQSISVKGVYPAGEGAGYAGGITSSAVDGVAIADVIAAKYF